MKSRSRNVLRPLKQGLVKTRILRAESIDKARSDQGTVTGLALGSASVAPSLFYHLFLRCGIGFSEAERLVKGKRLYLNGMPLQAVKALSVQLPAEILERVDVQLVNSRGYLVPALDRSLHRYYGIYNKTKDSVVAAARSEESDPRSVLHVLRRAPRVPASLLPPPPPSIAALLDKRPIVDAAQYEAVRALADGFDEASSLISLSAKALHQPNTQGLVLITNDATARSYFRWKLGCSTSFEVAFQRGTDTAALSSLEKLLHRELRAAKPVQDVVAPVATRVELQLKPKQHDGPILALDVPHLPPAVVRAILELGPEKFECTRYGDFMLKDANIGPGAFRALDDRELSIYWKMEKRFKTTRLVTGLRESAD